VSGRLARPGDSICALSTPFRDGHVDTDALASLVRRQVSAGTAGLVACGSTGEAPAPSAECRARGWRWPSDTRSIREMPAIPDWLKVVLVASAVLLGTALVRGVTFALTHAAHAL